MGQKVSPHGMRLGINKDWEAKWFAPSKVEWYEWLLEDVKIRNIIMEKERPWLIGKLVIEKTKKNLKIEIHTAKPGAVLGNGGENVKALEKKLKKTLNLKDKIVKVDVIEIKNPDLNARIIANEIAIALENRAPFRMAQKFAIRKVMRSGAKGIKTSVSGRLNGVDMARTEGYTHGIVPLQTFRQDIDYALAEANTTYGKLGVKVWISKGEILNKKNQNQTFDFSQKNKLNDLDVKSNKPNMKGGE